jgi:Chaperone for flagella basal body P-ring formation
MSRSLRLQVVHYICWISVLSVRGLVAIGSAQTACYSTANAAVESLKAGPSHSPALQRGGYRVTNIQSDPVLGQRWATVASCEHTEWAAWAVQINGPDVSESSQTNPIHMVNSRSIPVVHVGDIVRLWKQEDLLRIEVAGVSEENGGLGETIRVRLLPRNPDNQWIPEWFPGIVRGPFDVEIQP